MSTSQNPSATRRHFLIASAAAGGWAAGRAHAAPRSWRAVRSATIREKLRLGVVGVGGRGNANLGGVAHEEIVALCDVDARSLGRAAKRFGSAKRYFDAREMLEAGGLDGVVISTPDHTHAPIAAAALRKGMHVYCEKPLTHTVHEARVLRTLAREKSCVTQMGIQIHSGENYRRVVEAIRGNGVGPVREVHVFCNSKSWSNGRRPEKTEAVPDWMHWDLWLGPCASRPWNPKSYHPAQWRRFWDFGGGTLADMACHFMDLAWWALDLVAPNKIEARGPKLHEEGTPERLHVRYEHPERGTRKACTVHWYDGGERPEVLTRLGLQKWRSGVLFLGEDGRWLISDYGRHEVGPADKMQDYEAPERSIAKSIGHHREWTEACKKGKRTTCDFDYAGRLTEAVLLGNIAYRAGSEIVWDSEALRIPNHEEANTMLRKAYRKGWSL